jgi:hypothetical protein
MRRSACTASIRKRAALRNFLGELRSRAGAARTADKMRTPKNTSARIAVTFSSDALPGLSAYPALQLLFSEISVSSVSTLL